MKLGLAIKGIGIPVKRAIMLPIFLIIGCTTTNGCGYFTAYDGFLLFLSFFPAGYVLLKVLKGLGSAGFLDFSTH